LDTIWDGEEALLVSTPEHHCPRLDMALSKSGIWHLQKSILSSYLALSSGGQRRPVLDIRLAQACLFGQSALSRVVSAAGQFILAMDTRLACKCPN
jgi:hypothetical protein